MIKYFLILTLAVPTLSCGFKYKSTSGDSKVTDQKGQSVTPNNGTDPSEGSKAFAAKPKDFKIGFAEVNEKVFKPDCLRCHENRAPQVKTYEQVRKNLEEIRLAVLVEKTMPPRQPLKAEALKLLQDWIDQGASEVEVMPPSQSVVPSPTPVAPVVDPAPVVTVGPLPRFDRPVKFEFLKSKVLDVSCNSCHFEGNRSGLTALDKYDRVKSVAFVVIGTTLVEPMMPPAGDLPLTQEQKDILGLWYADGMQQ